MSVGEGPVAQDPFWGVVRRRHPDVDLVLLTGRSPLDPPAAEPDDAISLDEARKIERGVDDAYGSIRHLLPPDTPAPTRLWRAADGGHAYLNEKALRGLAGPRAVVTLRALARALQDRGWEVAASGDEARPHLMSTNGWIDLDVRSGAAATQLLLAGPVVPVRADDLATLKAER
ncbi:hypothetical protein [Aeromicrobium sp.]|uniref:hypothetical protein n=1 Tax=Aeromicrobium sp. TaxID=1871063 RepID=UPI003519824E